MPNDPNERSEPGKTPGKAEGEERKPTYSSEPGKTPGLAEGDEETEWINLGEPESWTRT